LVDTHCHLNFHSFKKDYAEIAKAAYDIGITKIINVGAKLDSSQKAVKLANEINYCFAAVGVHPHHAEEMVDSSLRWNDKNGNDTNTTISYSKVEEELTQIIEEDLKTTKKIVAIGECGLDYHEYNVVRGDLSVAPHADRPGGLSLRDKQKKLLEIHIKIAKKYNLPLIIHCRDAYSDLLNLLRTTYYPAFGGTSSLRTSLGVIHCFQGSLSDLKEFLQLGFYIGFDGYITYPDKVENDKQPESLDSRFRGNDKKEKNGKSFYIRKNPLEIREYQYGEKQEKLTQYELLVKNTPINLILTETDSPWLTPEPLRDTRNSPSNIKIITEKIAKIKGIAFEEVDRITSENAEKLFFHSI
jgi:TatD DNase family protein